MSIVLSGAAIKVYINGNLYPNVQNISYQVNYSVSELRGIDDPYPQELVTGPVSVSGQVVGIKVKADGGLTALGLTSNSRNILNINYSALRIEDRSTGLNLLWIPKILCQNMKIGIPVKGIVSLSFSFVGICAFDEIASYSP